MDKYPNTKLDSDIEVTVIKKDGNKKSYNTNYFEKLDIGDKLILNIRMPEKKPFINSSLCMNYITVQLILNIMTGYYIHMVIIR